jgi:vacuolar-type H+-ATPase subunit H
VSGSHDRPDAAPGATRPPAGALEELLRSERAGADALANARAEAERILAEARESANEREEGLQRELVRAWAELERSVRASCDERLAEIRADSEATAGGYAEVEEAEVERLAARVIDELVGTPNRDAP